MSEVPQRPEWWKASDGLWYPPEAHPTYVHPPAPSKPVEGSQFRRGLNLGVGIGCGLLIALVVLWLAVGVLVALVA